MDNDLKSPYLTKYFHSYKHFTSLRRKLSRSSNKSDNFLEWNTPQRHEAGKVEEDTTLFF